jgi:hypothetical protein
MSQSFAIASSALSPRANNNGSSLSAVHMEVETHNRAKRVPQASIRGNVGAIVTVPDILHMLVKIVRRDRYAVAPGIFAPFTTALRRIKDVPHAIGTNWKTGVLQLSRQLTRHRHDQSSST